MENSQPDNNAPSSEENLPTTEPGNASNPAPRNDEAQPATHQLLDEKAEKYLREVASIEDVPDAQDQQEMDETLNGESNESKG